MTPQQIKCTYILEEMATLEKEKNNLLALLKRETSEQETKEIIKRLKMIEIYHAKLRELATKLICEVL